MDLGNVYGENDGQDCGALGLVVVCGVWRGEELSVTNFF